jgi:hypothetical protein
VKRQNRIIKRCNPEHKKLHHTFSAFQERVQAVEMLEQLLTILKVYMRKHTIKQNERHHQKRQEI